MWKGNQNVIKTHTKHSQKNTATSGDAGIRHIECEGLVDGSTLVLNYKNKQGFMIQLDTFCCEYFYRCEIYRMLMDTKYSEE